MVNVSIVDRFPTILKVLRTLKSSEFVVARLMSFADDECYVKILG